MIDQLVRAGRLDARQASHSIFFGYAGVHRESGFRLTDKNLLRAVLSVIYSNGALLKCSVGTRENRTGSRVLNKLRQERAVLLRCGILNRAA